MIRSRTSRWLLSASLLAMAPAAVLADKDAKDQKAGAPKVEGKGPGSRVEHAPPAGASQPRTPAASRGDTPELPATIGPRPDRRPDNPIPPANVPAQKIQQQIRQNRESTPPASAQNQLRDGQHPNMNRDALQQQIRNYTPPTAPGAPPANVQNQIPGAPHDGQRPNLNRDAAQRQNPANNAPPSDRPIDPKVYQPLRQNANPNANPNATANTPPVSDSLKQIQDANRTARQDAAEKRARDAAQQRAHDAAQQPRANDSAQQQQRANDAAQRQAAQNRAAQDAAQRQVPQGTVNQNIAPNNAQHDVARDARRAERHSQRTLNDIFGARKAESTANANVQVQANQDRATARIAADNAARNYFTGTPRQNRNLRAEARQAARQEYGSEIRRGFVGRSANVFSQRWWGTHRNAWGNQWSTYPAWSNRFGNGSGGQAYGFGSYWPWQAASWTTLAALQPTVWTQPIYYDYGGNVYYQDGMVYFDNRPTMSIVDYATSARRLATLGVVDAGNPEDWTPLGVFALADENGADPSLYFQLALNKNGALGGNFYNAYSDQTAPIQGSVDNDTQRAAWVIATNPDTVFETGLYNLTQPETSILAHLNNNEDETLFMVRVDAPETATAPVSATQP